jgi:hexosaminidase
MDPYRPSQKLPARSPSRYPQQLPRTPPRYPNGAPETTKHARYPGVVPATTKHPRYPPQPPARRPAPRRPPPKPPRGPLDHLVTLKRLATFLVIGLAVVVVVAASLNSLGWVTLPLVGAANPAPKVVPSLREWQGSAGTFSLGARSHIAVDPAAGDQLTAGTNAFESDLAVVTGRKLPVVQTDSPGSGDFYLTLGNSDRGLGDEGYLLTVGDTLTIGANTSRGVFYGTRTALQILLQDPAHAHIPKGIARDYPEYKERGFMLDAGRKYFPLSFLEDEVKLMSWFKLNDFHIHFNDNAFGTGSDWMHQYAAFRLNSDAFPGLAAKDGSYSQQDIRQLVAVADAYGVTITPEIDTPAHDLALTQFRPDLASGVYSKEFLDLTNPNTFTFVNSLWDTFLPWFDTSQVSIGADEYAAADASRYRQFINTYDAYLKAKGKSVRVWGSLSIIQSSVKVNSDVVMEVWDNGWQNPVDTVRQGFSVINVNDNLLYIVPKAGGFNDFLNTQLLYEKWEPNIFDLNNSAMNLQPNDPHLLGGEFAEWNDRYGIISVADVEARVRPAMPVLGDKMWSGPANAAPYDQFEQLVKQLGDAPGTHLP